MPSIEEIKREKDLIRAEMERVVAAMQRCETELDAGQPGKREELTALRDQLTDLRSRMKSVMVQASSTTGGVTTQSDTHHVGGYGSETTNLPRGSIPSPATQASISSTPRSVTFHQGESSYSTFSNRYHGPAPSHQQQHPLPEIRSSTPIAGSRTAPHVQQNPSSVSRSTLLGTPRATSGSAKGLVGQQQQQDPQGTPPPQTIKLSPARPPREGSTNLTHDSQLPSAVQDSSSRYVSPANRRSSSIPRAGVNGSVPQQTPSGGSDVLLSKLRSKHVSEKQQLREEYERQLAAMERRHAEEVRQCNDICMQEAQMRKEFEESRMKMERAQRNLERMAAQQQTRAPAPEVAALSHLGSHHQ